MENFIRILLALCFLLGAEVETYAQSTINPNIPAQNSPLSSAPIRGNFAAAFNDVNSILNATLNPLSLAKGGTGAALAASSGGIVYSGGAALAILAGTPVSNRIPLSGANSAPSWSTATFPSDVATGQVLNGVTAHSWNATSSPVLGNSGIAGGSLGFAGATGGTVTLTPQATAGTVTLTMPNASGTIADTATSPLALSATTGALTCATCVTSSGGGAITGTAPISVSAAGVVSITSPLPQANGGSTLFVGGPTAGTANAQTLASAIPNNFALTAGNTVCSTIGNTLTNTGATTLSVNGTTATAVDRQTSAGLVALAGGEIVANRTSCFQYDGTVYELITPITSTTLTKSANYTATIADGIANGNLIVFTAAATLTLPKASTLPKDWRLNVIAESGTLTLTPNAADSLNGGTAGASSTLNSGFSTPITTDGVSNIYASNLGITVIGNSQWSTWVPTVACGTGTITTLGTVVARFQQLGKTTFINLNIPITTLGTCASTLSATLPAPAKAQTSMNGREAAINGKTLGVTVPAASSTLTIQNYDNTFPGASGVNLAVSGVYEAQ